MIFMPVCRLCGMERAEHTATMHAYEPMSREAEIERVALRIEDICHGFGGAMSEERMEQLRAYLRAALSGERPAPAVRDGCHYCAQGWPLKTSPYKDPWHPYPADYKGQRAGFGPYCAAGERPAPKEKG